jgi:predicted membrane channel-forming protein YqfA (hemolysin III family)
MGIHMVNEEKLRIMVNLARYEQEPLHTELKEAGYYRIDYIRSHLLVTLWSYSVAYVLVLLLVALYHFEYIFSKVRLPDIGSLAIGALAVYVLILLGCAFFTVLISSAKYHRIQSKRRAYLTELKKMELFYEQSREVGNE